jgi:hypothetical protein
MESDTAPLDENIWQVWRQLKNRTGPPEATENGRYAIGIEIQVDMQFSDLY